MSTKAANVKSQKSHSGSSSRASTTRDTRRPNRSQAQPVPVAFSQSYSSQAPLVSSTKEYTQISHREFFSSVVSDGTQAQLSVVTIQPSSESLFPWLSKMAVLYERYHFDEFHVEYIPRVATTAEGSVVVAVDPDIDDTVIGTDDYGRRALLAHQGATENNIWKRTNLTYPRNRLDSSPASFVSLLSASSQERRLCDLGRLYLGFYGSNVPLNKVYGDFFVSYRIRLYYPQLSWEIPETGENRLRATMNCPEGELATVKSHMVELTGSRDPSSAVFQTSASWGWDNLLPFLNVKDRGLPTMESLISFLGMRSNADGNVPLALSGAFTIGIQMSCAQASQPPADLTVAAYAYDAGVIQELQSQQLDVIRAEPILSQQGFDWYIFFTCIGTVSTILSPSPLPPLTGLRVVLDSASGGLDNWTWGSLSGESSEYRYSYLDFQFDGLVIRDAETLRALKQGVRMLDQTSEHRAKRSRRELIRDARLNVVRRDPMAALLRSSPSPGSSKAPPRTAK